MCIPPLGLYYKILWTRNLQEMNIFRSELVNFGWDKYTVLGQTKTLAYYQVCRLRIRNVFYSILNTIMLTVIMLNFMMLIVIAPLICKY